MVYNAKKEINKIKFFKNNKMTLVRTKIKDAMAYLALGGSLELTLPFPFYSRLE